MSFPRLLRAPVLAAALLLSGAPMGLHAQSAPPAATSQGPDAWEMLSPEQQAQLAPLRDQWNQLPPDHQQQLADKARRWATLPPEK
ncbi:MAG TPA: DUF3106 domain-containing protein, partial [Rhodanobacteraceae bacterium]|nr:DUF3106 domain-containing protein [Rhodanobacteraceae bacterium]